MMRPLVNLALRPLVFLVNLMPPERRAALFMKLITPLSGHDRPDGALRFLFHLDSGLYALQGEAAIRYDDGVHTKHRHMNYHRFFIDQLKAWERVLDIGSGNGFLAWDMATQVEGATVVGIELNDNNVRFARQRYKAPNLEFIHGDALKDLPGRTFDVVTLSNVLEHIEDRHAFLIELMKNVRPVRLILRVPLYERDWRVPLKEELAIDYRLDKTHYIEYRLEEFLQELDAAGLSPVHIEQRWGEIWAVAVPAQKTGEG